MRWKVLLASLVIVGIVGLLLFATPAQNYLGFFGNGVGQFFSTITGGSVFPSAAGNYFSMSLVATKEEFYGQSYDIKNSSVFITGDYRKIEVGDQIINLKKIEPVSIMIRNMKGEIAFLGDGSIKISADSTNIEIDDYSMISDKPKKINVNIVPNRMLVSYFEKDKIVFDSITGELKRFVKTNIDQINLSDNKLEILRFNGLMRLSENGIVELTGIAESVKGDGFAFSAS